MHGITDLRPFFCVSKDLVGWCEEAGQGVKAAGESKSRSMVCFLIAQMMHISPGRHKNQGSQDDNECFLPE